MNCLFPNCLHSEGKKVGSLTVGPLKTPLGEVVTDSAKMSVGLMFASAFASVYAESDPTSPSPYQTVDISIPDIDISISDVTWALNQQNPSSAMGPDGIHPFFLRSCASQIAYPLTLIFRCSLEYGFLPQIWKQPIVN